ncbi:MAG TPA: histidine kinase [Albitalea sp.]
MAANTSPSTATPGAPRGAARFFQAVRRGFIAYARWLDGISWKRFFLLSVLAMIATGILSEIPPFNLPWGADRTEVRPPDVAREARRQRERVVIDGIRRNGKRYEVIIDEDGVHVRPIAPAASAPPAGASPAVPGVPAPPASMPPAVPPPGVSVVPDEGVTIRLPPGAESDEVKEAIEEAEAEMEARIEEAQREVEEAIQEARPQVRRIRAFRLGDHMPPFMALWIFVSMIIKIMAAGRFKAEAQAAQATRSAESEALKRQVVEARMAAMQAQVEPHFLFNTLASIDHLIETDPPRASRMQKNLIALLRASMPTMREANGAIGLRDLGRELAVIRPYLEILKVRMEDRLHTEVRVPDGLLSADFPPMMLQSLVENAIKHGLEPKPEGGKLTVRAQIVHGKLAVTVADTGLGFGRAATAGTGVGLANIRERLRLLYGSRASLTVGANEPSGTVVTVTVPYAARTRDDDASDPRAAA